MILIKIQCGCGQKYSFDVEPLERAMPWPVLCPVCGTDGTEAANLTISDLLGPQTPPDLRIRNAVPGCSPGTNCFSRTRSVSFESKRSPTVRLRSKWLSFPSLASIAILLALAAGGYAFQTRRAQPNSGTASGKDAFPRTLAEVNALYVDPPDGKNAANIYLQAFAALKSGSGSTLPLLGGGTLAPPWTPLPLPQKSLITTLLRANSEALSLLAQAAKYEQCRYPIDLSLGFDATLPHLPKLRRSALTLELSSLMHAEAHQGKEAASDVLAILALGRSLELEPSLISQLVRVATVSAALASLEQTLNRTDVPKESLADLMICFKKLETREADGKGFTQGLVAERANWAALLSNPQKLGQALNSPGINLSPDDRERIFARIQQGGEFKAEQAQLDLVFGKLMAVRNLTFPGRLKGDEYIRQQINEAAERKLTVMGVLLQAFAAHAAKEAESLGKLRLGIAAIAVQQFRAENGTYPDDLSKLVPKCLDNTMLDPFDGEPIRYRTDAVGFTLHCMDSKLDAPSANKQTNHKESGLVFIVKGSLQAHRTE